MANNVIVLYAAGATELVSPGQIITPGEGLNFDTVTERRYFPTAASAQTYRDGGTADPTNITGGSWLCLGLSDIERLPGSNGTMIATVTWRGLKSSSNFVSWNYNRSVRETNYEAISGIPGTTGSVQGRLLDIVEGITVRQIGVGAPPAPPAPQHNNNNVPGVTGLRTPSRITTVINTAKIHTYPAGWQCYAWNTEEPLKGYYLLSAEWKYEHPVIFG